MLEPHVLVINAGSSTLKFAGYSQAGLRCLYRGLLDASGSANSTEFKVSAEFEQVSETHSSGLNVMPVLQWLERHDLVSQVVAIGHRVVHGGSDFTQPVIVNADVIAAIQENARFAPLHNPANLAAIEDCERQFAGVPQVAVFDTAFHQSLPAHAYLYPLPLEWYQQHGVRRYGFHGTSHAYVAQSAAKGLGKPVNDVRLITVHLGNGCSTCAIVEGKSVDTSMGFTPLEGLMMGTRCGTIDPGLAQYLCKTLALDIDALTQMLNKNSGLLGTSGCSSDMRKLEAAAAEGNGQARLAIEMFCFRAAKSIAEMLVSVPNLDALVFTGGIGENATQVRSMILQHLHFMNFKLDQEANSTHGASSGGIIAYCQGERRGERRGEARPCVMVVATDEEKMISQMCMDVIESGTD